MRRYNYYRIVLMVMTILFYLVTEPCRGGEPSSVHFTVEGGNPGKIIGNKVSNINLWMMQTFKPGKKDEGANLSGFVEYVQFMQATGSSEARELFKNPTDASVLDDYQFDPLLKACQTTLDLGAKPHIKFSVPLKYTAELKIGVFGTNVYPPKDYDVYYRFVAAMARSLVERFGREEVLKWRFGVLTEFENRDWFCAIDGSPEKSREAYLKLYDYTVAGLMNEIGPNVFVGAHAMACTEGLWDERDFLEHCANGINYKTGKKGTRICFMAASFYDYAPGKPNKISLPDVIDHLRTKARQVGLNDLIYGIDEGRILGGRKGKNATDLIFRIVGQTYQASFDARIIKQMVDHDIDYFSAWSFSSSDPWNGFPTVAYHVAVNAVQFKNDALLPITSEKKLDAKVECDALAGWNKKDQVLHVMAYNFNDTLDYKDAVNITTTIKVPFWSGHKVQITESVIDDQVNFFVQWLKDRETYKIPDTVFSWSPDSANLDIAISDPSTKRFYQKELRPHYVKISQLHPNRYQQTVSKDGELKLQIVLNHHGVVFYSIAPVKE